MIFHDLLIGFSIDCLMIVDGSLDGFLNCANTKIIKIIWFFTFRMQIGFLLTIKFYIKFRS